MDIKIIISMFEDLKKLTSEQFSNLSKLVESLANAKSDPPVLPIIPQVDLSELENHVTETDELIREGFQKQQEQLHEFQQRLEKQKDKPLPFFGLPVRVPYLCIVLRTKTERIKKPI